MNLKAICTALLAFACFASPVIAQSLIKPGRAIQVSIKGVPPDEQSKIDGMYPVSESGMINMPHIGLMRAAGMRAEDLAASIQATYRSREIYRNPTIQVFGSTIETIDKQVVHLGGQVRRPGQVEYTPGLTLWQAIQAAGGSTEFGSMKRVKLIRGTSQKTFDLTQSQFMRVPLEQNDVIDIPQKNWIGQ
jgi:protein involved in polysaccharide export with SLBB domain